MRSLRRTSLLVAPRTTAAQIHHGRRVTSATSYLAQALNRSNLDIVVNTRVTKLISVGNVFGQPDFRGVEFTQTANGSDHNLKAYLGMAFDRHTLGTRHTMHAAKEVILSAGSVKSPHICACGPHLSRNKSL